ncbi:DUF1389 domain-containing protein [Chlamydia vaughanii]|uniref:DUF1389 domain-containing protein n=1 Tax=Chlamydia vaughanii TaxID=3112552 RepID=UPI0032B22B05
MTSTFSGGVTTVNQQNSVIFADRSKTCRIILTIGGIILAALALSHIAILACGITHFAVIISFVVTVVLSIAILAIAIRSYKKPTLPIPRKFLEIIKTTYPPIVYELCIEQKLTIHELRHVLQVLETKSTSLLPKKVMRKVNRFGFERVLSECAGTYMESLSRVQARHCPFFFLKSFVDFGFAKAAEEKVLTPIGYWLGLVGEELLLDVSGWLYAQVITHEQHQRLYEHARNGTWEGIVDLAGNILDDMCDLLEEIPDVQLPNKKEVLEVIMKPSRLSNICLHGMNWKQILLLRSVSISDCAFLQEYQQQGGDLEKTMTIIYPHLGKDTYDPNISMMTWGEWKIAIQDLMEQGALDLHEQSLKWLSRYSTRGTLFTPMS